MNSNYIIYAVILVVIAAAMFILSGLNYSSNVTLSVATGLVGLVLVGIAGALFYKNRKPESKDLPKTAAPSRENEVAKIDLGEKSYQADDSNDGTVKRWWRNL